MGSRAWAKTPDGAFKLQVVAVVLWSLAAAFFMFRESWALAAVWVLGALVQAARAVTLYKARRQGSADSLD